MLKKLKNQILIAAYEGIVELVEVIKTRNIRTLDLRMNPIGCDGAAAIFGIIYKKKKYLKEIDSKLFNPNRCNSKRHTN